VKATANLVVTRHFDELHRLDQKDINRSGAPSVYGTKQQVLEYDGLGRVTRAVDDLDPSDGLMDSQVKMTYDSLSQTKVDIYNYAPRQGVYP
jgi:hypothetical protein